MWGVCQLRLRLWQGAINDNMLPLKYSLFVWHQRLLELPDNPIWWQLFTPSTLRSGGGFCGGAAGETFHSKTKFNVWLKTAASSTLMTWRAWFCYRGSEFCNILVLECTSDLWNVTFYLFVIILLLISSLIDYFNNTKSRDANFMYFS